MVAFRTQFARVLPAVRRPALVALVALFTLHQPAAALVVGTVTDTTVNPASYPGWTLGDPGWQNVTQSGPNFVYLGDSWILTARHVSNPTPSTPATASFSTGSFTSIPNQSFIVKNPPPNLVNSLNLTAETDLRLIRINGDPGLPSLTIASQTPPFAGNNGSEVMFIGQGRIREVGQTSWDVNTGGANWVWTEVGSCAGVNCYQGYETTPAPTVKRWGTNRLGNVTASTFDEPISHTLNNRTAILPIKTADGVTRDIVTMLSVFDRQNQNGALPFEAQAVANNSGSAVFYKNLTTGQWELAGIVNSILTYNSQSSANAVYGNATTFADLSYYNKDYSGSIADIIASHREYSIPGDLNLDGVVSGNGAGPVASDDVAAFIAGWNYQQPMASVTSWKKGDLNLDGRTDVSDFVLFRNTLNGTGSSAALASFMAGLGLSESATGVPEPASGVLLLLGVGSWLAWGAWGRGGSRCPR